MKRISSTFTKPLSTLNFKRFHQLFFCTLPYITSIKIGERFIAEVFLRKETAVNAALFSFAPLRKTFFMENFRWYISLQNHYEKFSSFFISAGT